MTFDEPTSGHSFSHRSNRKRRARAPTTWLIFIPGVDRYDVETVVELEATRDGVGMVLTFDAMHNDEWTQPATMGWESELGKLTTALGSHDIRTTA